LKRKRMGKVEVSRTWLKTNPRNLIEVILIAE